ncbi:MAG: CHAD domain-containing protein [Acidobacteria bacterium]|nr:CHAD domain-containing protein [Acidobacteriota bacterium]
MSLEGQVESNRIPPIKDRVLAAARRQLDRFAALESKVLRGDNPNAIHDIRVASRRLQQMLDLIYPATPPQKIRKLRRAIRRCRRILSAVRNYDVLLARAERSLSRRRTSRRQAWQAFRDYLEEQRERSFRKASRRLGKLDLPGIYVRLRENFGSLGGTEIRFGPASVSGPTRHGDSNAALHDTIANQLRETWASLVGAVRKAQEDRDAPALHAVRIAAKKTRYLIEVIHILESPRSNQALSCLRRLQRQLGDWHDLEILEETMLEMVANSGILQEQLELAMDVEKLVLQNRKRKKAYEKKFFEMAESSGEWDRLGNWVQAYLTNDSSHPLRSVAGGHSAAFPPSTT